MEAFRRLSKPGIYRILVREKDGTEKKISLEIGDNEKSGLVMDYDLSLGVVREIEKVIKKRKARQTVLLASEWGAPLLAAGLKNSTDQGTGGTRIEVITVPNRTFGGTIRSAGLLLIDDFRAALRGYLKEGKSCDLALLPALAFDRRGLDLTGLSYYSLGEEFGLQVEPAG